MLQQFDYLNKPEVFSLSLPLENKMHKYPCIQSGDQNEMKV
jgi:hypothetical protein